MSDPVVLKLSRYQAWVASIDPPLFLSSLIEFMAEGGRT